MADRSRETFGVSGLLAEDCKVFYATLFSPKHLGRVSDLLAARLEQAQADDLRLRSLLLFSVYEAFRTREDQASTAQYEPLSVECGLDSERLAVGVSFTIDAALAQSLAEADFAARVLRDDSTSEFEILLQHLCRLSRAVHVRVQPARRRVELVSIIGVPSPDVGAMTLEVIVLAENVGEAPAPGEYIEIGDLNYTELLREGGPTVEANEIKAGKLLFEALESQKISGSGETTENTVVKGVTDQRMDESVKVEGTENESLVSTKVDGSAAESLTKTTIRAGNLPENEAYGHIGAGGNRAQTSDPYLRVAGKSTEFAGPPIEEIQNYQRRIAELERQLAQESRDLMPASLIVNASEKGAARSSVSVSEGDDLAATITKRLRRIFSFGNNTEEEVLVVGRQKPPTSETAIEQAETLGPISTAEIKVDSGEKSPTDDPSLGATFVNSDEASDLTRKEVAAQNVYLEAALARAQKEAKDLSNELTSTKAKRFVEGMISELVSEKSRVNEMGKKLTTSVRQKELEFKNRERALQEEVKRKDEQLRSKASAIARAKDQMAQLSLTVERMKASGSGGSDDAHLKQRLTQNQRLLQVAKDENRKLKAKLDETKSSLSTAQLAAANNRGPTPQEVTAMQVKLTHAQRLADDFKRQNAMLMEKVEKRERELKDRPAAPLSDDVRKRLEGAMRLITLSRKESEMLQLKVEELTREEARLRRELELANAHGKAAAASTGRADGASLLEAMQSAAASTAASGQPGNEGGESSGNAA